MFAPGDIISYIEMCKEEGASLQRGMNFRLKGKYSVILMSVRKGAPYADMIEEDGEILIYEGHDISRKKDGPNPKKVDQPLQTPNGKPTQNCLFYEAAKNYKNNSEAELIRVYEKINPHAPHTGAN